LSESTIREFAPYVATTYPTTERQFTAMVPALKQMGYLKDAKVAVFLDNNPNLDSAYSKILEPALRAAGAEPVAVARAGQTDSAGQAGAVLRFRGAGADHVIFAAGIVQYLSFSNAARSQGYHPRYAFPDYQGIPAAAASLGSPSQLEGAVAVSSCDLDSCVAEDASRSSTDTTTPYNPAKLSPGLKRCLDYLSRVRKVNYYKPAEASASSVFTDVCDHFLLFLDALASGDTDPKNFGVHLKALGRTYLSPGVHATNFGDGRQSGATDFAGGAYDERCACYVRKTAWTRLG
jgi:hypothetical protein